MKQIEIIDKFSAYLLKNKVKIFLFEGSLTKNQKEKLKKAWIDKNE